ncbi:MAG: oligoendopeptidase F [Acidimicrobiales bacterium]|nr:MAG: oligoendopeptidase F [Acidimicrobiales bacterium]
MTTSDSITTATGAEDTAWDVETLVDGNGPDGARALLDRAAAMAAELIDDAKGRVATANAAQLAAWLDQQAEMFDATHRAANYAQLRFSTDVADPANGALMAEFQERTAALAADLVWFELEWLAMDEDVASALLSSPELADHRHHLETSRLRLPHVLSEPEERLLATKSPTGRSAWVRLFTELTSAIRVDLDGESQPLEAGLSRLLHPDRAVRQEAAAAVTAGLEPGLRNRAFVFNTLLADKATDDRLRDYPSWITAWNQGNEASDASVDALIEAVVSRYDLPQRWYRLKAQVLGVERLADYDRGSSVAETNQHVPWETAKATVRDAYASFSDELASIVDRFYDEGWIDAPVRDNKRGGAFCAYTVPSHHPYVFLNYTATPGDVLTLAHELGHAVHGFLARPQGIFHQSTPLTLAETASVFGETVTFERLLDQTDDAGERFALLAQQVEGNIATVFRQVAMNRFEDAVHTHRRDVGELSTDDFADHWARTQTDLFGDSVEVTDDYRSWWSYIPHFIGTPGYVYAYAYGQLLALSVYAQYEVQGAAFVPSYLELLGAGGSRWPEELAAIVGCDLTDPGFWSAGLDIVDAQIGRAEDAARAAGRV